tara:strand:+ start:16106 stop:16945 length:840 start_codon:yes stop_codon:yes gene_type:complete
MNLLTERNHKLLKKDAELGYIVAGLSLLPNVEVNKYTDLISADTCPMSTPGCRESCCNTTGRGIYEKSQLARARRTIMFYTEREAFLYLLREDLCRLKERASRRRLLAACRLNIYSDILWELYPIIYEFTEIQFYDYTKILDRVIVDGRKSEMPPNYYLTFSRSEDNIEECHKALDSGTNVACVFKDTKPTSWMGHEVIDGDEHDQRFLDPSVSRDSLGIDGGWDVKYASDEPHIIALSAKGRGRKDDTGFVIDYDTVQFIRARNAMARYAREEQNLLA